MERAIASARPTKRDVRRRRILPLRVQRVIRRARARIRAILPNGELQSLVLYGSYVYGKPRPDSDVDLLLVYDDVKPEQEQALKDLALDLYDERPRTHLFLYRAEQVARENGMSPLLYNVTHHGILLEGVPMPIIEIHRERVSAHLVTKAKTALRDAQVLLDVGGDEGSIARSFYAVLHPSDAALASKGFVAKSHERTEVMFAHHFFKTMLVDEQCKGLFKRIRDVRIKADYKYDVEFTRIDAEYRFERARAFVAAIEAGIPQWLAEQK